GISLCFVSYLTQPGFQVRGLESGTHQMATTWRLGRSFHSRRTHIGDDSYPSISMYGQPNADNLQVAAREKSWCVRPLWHAQRRTLMVLMPIGDKYQWHGTGWVVLKGD